MRGLDLNMSIHNPCTLLWPLCTVLLEQSSSVHKLDPIVELSEEEKGKAVEWLSVVVCGMLASVCMDPWLRSVCSVWACAKVKCWACQTKGMSWKICLLSKHRCYSMHVIIGQLRAEKGNFIVRYSKWTYILIVWHSLLWIWKNIKVIV